MDRVCLGLALPDKRRLGFHAEVAAISRHRPPLALGEVLNAVPQSWLPRVTLLASRLEEVGLEARVYGSTAWQAMTGTTYLREDSDLDLLLTPATAEQLRLLSGILAAMEGAHPRVDGEIVLADGSAVAWREAASGSTTLLVKSLAGVALVPRAAWLSALREPAHA
jgi:phosphoribosyl-dephospho-CoA transferase